jgi:hypothetical protein
MLPRLHAIPQLNQTTIDYLTALQQQDFEGEIESSYSLG